MIELFYSRKTRQALAAADGKVPLGAAHYSYGFVADKFVDLLSSCSYSFEELVRPELIPALTVSEISADAHRKVVHLIMKPFEEIRILKGAYNVAYLMWEFDRLPEFARLPDRHPGRVSKLYDYLHMIKLCDEVWVGCTFTQRVFESAGIRSVHVIPTPVLPPRVTPHNRSERRLKALDMLSQIYALPISAEVGSLSQRRRKLAELVTETSNARIFVAVINPGDMRKNLPTLLRSFARVHLRDSRNILLLKLVIDNKVVTYEKVIKEILPARFREVEMDENIIYDCEGIYTIAEYLPSSQLSALFFAADFYICSSYAEGQNLPMLEAMSHGVVPISPRTTAMEDYISENCAIVVPTQQEVMNYAAQEAYRLYGAQWDVVHVAALEASINKACELSVDEQSALSSVARRSAGEFCGWSATDERIRRRFVEWSA